MCKKCNKLHELEGGKDSAGNPTEILLFYKCGENDYLGAVANKLVIDVIPTVSGRLS